MNPILKPLIFTSSTSENSKSEPRTRSFILDRTLSKCLLCDETFSLPAQRDGLLGHLLLNHKLVIADVKEIADLAVYLEYWRERFAGSQDALKEFCFTFNTQVMQEDDSTYLEEYFMLASELPEDCDLRKQLQQERLQLVLDQQRREREDLTFKRSCLFCRKIFSGNRKELLEHMNFDHNFSVGQADNIVFVDEFLNILDQKLEKLECLYCERTFKDRTVLKEHMRKKQHKKINSQNHFYDKFYVVNYLEPGKTWKEIMEERDDTASRKQTIDEDAEWSDWQEEEQPQVVCLFCPFRAKVSVDIFQHMQQQHDFDLPGLSEINGWSFYQQVKLVNYIRRQVHQKKCAHCDEQFDQESDLQTHMEQNLHAKLPSRELWDQAEFYFPTYENDALLYLLEDRPTTAENQVAIIPEDPTVKSSILQEESVRKELL